MVCYEIMSSQNVATPMRSQVVFVKLDIDNKMKYNSGCGTGIKLWSIIIMNPVCDINGQTKIEVSFPTLKKME